MMNSTVMPDKMKPEDTFPDHNFTTLAIKALREFHRKNQEHYMVGLGFKMPHTALHIPYRYFDMYRSRALYAWNMTDKERVYPLSSPPQVRS